MSDLYLRILLQAKDTASSVVKALGGNVGGLSKVLTVGAVAATGLAVALGVETVQKSADFQQAMLSNAAHAGLAKDQYDKTSAAVLNMATDVGRAPTQLAEALYPILSAFSGIQNQSQKAALSLDTLKMSFQAVAGTTVDGTAVANAAVGTFNALGYGAANVTDKAGKMKALFDVMDLTVQQGNMQWDQYKNVISKLAVSIQGTGISFTEASAALATMTNMGYSAQKAQTYLSNTFTTLAIKTDALAKHAKKLGIEFDQAKYGPMSLADKIKYLNDITDGNKQKLLALLGNNSTALKTFNALSTGVGAYTSNLDALNHAQGALATSFDTAAQGVNFQASQMKAAFDTVLITIGSKLLPVLSLLMQDITPLIQQFIAWMTESGALSSATDALTTAVGYVPGILAGVVIAIQSVLAWWGQWHDAIQINAILITVLFIPAMIKAGVEAVISALKITYSFVASIVQSGIEGYVAAGKLALYIGALIATGVQAGVAGGIMTAKFVVSLVASMVQAGATALALTGSLIPALYAMGVAFYAATGPIGLVVGLVALLGLAMVAMKNQSDAMQLGTTGAWDTMGNKIERSSGRIIVSADQIAASTDAMRRNVVESWAHLNTQTYSQVNMLTTDAMNMFQKMGDKIGIDMSTLDTMAIGYWNDVAAYISGHPINGYVNLNTGGNISGTGNVHHFASGIENFAGGLAYVHGGEVLANLRSGTSVVPANRVTFGGGSGVAGSHGGNLYLTIEHIHVNDFGPAMPNSVANAIVDKVDQKLGMRYKLQTNSAQTGVN